MQPIIKGTAAVLRLLLLLTGSIAALADPSDSDIHVLFLTDCSQYSDWQTVGMAFSHKITKQPGSITRVMCCKEEERQRYNHELLALMPTHVAPSFAYNERTKDWYAAYNKPGAVVDFMKHIKPKEDWVLVVDSDMLLLKQFHPGEYNLSSGWIVSAPYTYLVGVSNDLWKRHIPHIAARDDDLAGPVGRHADQVGGFFFAHRDDMARMAPLWLNTTEEVREDTEAWRLSGDMYVEKGGKPWISEMYGYVYGAAKANVWHRWEISTMHYPNYQPEGIPKLNHYGLAMEIDDYKWDKHHHFDFNVLSCPPWNLPKDAKGRKGGIFVPPPHPTQLKSHKNRRSPDYYTDLIRVETVATLNAAFCDYHLSHCPPSQQLLDVCTEALTLYVDTVRELNEVESNLPCKDLDKHCKQWKKEEQCDKLPHFMNWQCGETCGFCGTDKAARPMMRNEPEDTLAALDALKAKLAAKTTAPAKAPGSVASKQTKKITPCGDKQPASSPTHQDKPTKPNLRTDTEAVREDAVAVAPQTVADGGEEEAVVSGDKLHSSKAETLRALLYRCSSMKHLTAQQVKQCAEAAAHGKRWQAPTVLRAGDGNEVEQAQRRKVQADQVDDGQVEDGTDDEAGGGVVKRVTHAGMTSGKLLLLWPVVLVAVFLLVRFCIAPKRKGRGSPRARGRLE